MGEFMKYLPLTLIITLSSSLFVGLVINPVIAARFMKVQERVPLRKTFQEFLVPRGGCADHRSAGASGQSHLPG